MGVLKEIVHNFTKLRPVCRGKFDSLSYPSVAKKPLPKPPVPALEKTLGSYLEYASVICSPEQLAITKKHVATFQTKCGQLLSDKLQKISELDNNWVNRFWLPEMYLNIRLALPVNSNPAYIFPTQTFADKHQKLRYTAAMIRGMCDFKDLIDKDTLEKDTYRGGVPMCMRQYGRVFTAYREPMQDTDVQHQKTDANLRGNQHVIALCNNQVFVVRTRIGGETLSTVELAYQLGEVERMAANRCDLSVIPLGLLTAAERNVAAGVLRQLKQHHENVVALEWVRSSAFIVCLDRNTGISDAVSPLDAEANMAAVGRYLLHGNGSGCGGANRWYDKTLQLVVSDDGVNGLNIEHSVAEGIVLIRMAEFALGECAKELAKREITVATKQLKPKPLTWYVGSDVKTSLENIRKEYDRLAKDLELEVLTFETYGKNVPKSHKISPDAFVQLMLQLTYFRTHGHLVSSYESASIRRFRDGRVDNIRSATPECFHWVKTMEDKTKSQIEKRATFDTAVRKQAQVLHDNITGYGIDNHLAALYVLAREEAASQNDLTFLQLFRDPAFAQLVRFPLSTSQVSVTAPDSYLCYGPVVADGYGCAYSLAEHRMLFAISAFTSDEKTDARMFKENLRQTLIDMQRFLDQKEE